MVKVGNALLHTTDIHSQVLHQWSFTIPDLQQLATVMKSQLIMVLAAAIDQHTFSLRESSHGVFDTRCQGQRAKRILLKRARAAIMPRAKEKDFPAACRSIVQK